MLKPSNLTLFILLVISQCVWCHWQKVTIYLQDRSIIYVYKMSGIDSIYIENYNHIWFF